jgi:hypothetical protein
MAGARAWMELTDIVGYPRMGKYHSHSMVPGGLLVTS